MKTEEKINQINSIFAECKTNTRGARLLTDQQKKEILTIIKEVEGAEATQIKKACGITRTVWNNFFKRQGEQPKKERTEKQQEKISKKRYFNFLIDDELVFKFKIIALKKRKAMGELASELFEDYVKKHKDML